MFNQKLKINRITSHVRTTTAAGPIEQQSGGLFVACQPSYLQRLWRKIELPSRETELKAAENREQINVDFL
jgi:hypothetical protein